MVRTYHLRSARVNCSVNLRFSEGYLTSVEITFKDSLKAELHNTLFASIPQQEKDLTILYRLGLKEVNDKSPKEKISMYCDKYMEHHEGRKYKATGIDGIRIKEFPVSYEILEVYFKSAHWKIKGAHSIQNFLANYNLVLEEMATGNKSKYPDHWIEKFEATLTQQQISEYWAHLRGLGLVAQKDRVGKTIDWVKKPDR